MKTIIDLLQDIILILTILICGIPALILGIVFYFIVLKDIDLKKDIKR